MSQWWQGLAEKWSWDDPLLLLGLVTVLVTALIPVFIWRLGTKQLKRDAALNELQAESLVRQEQIARRQRRDALLEIVDRSSDATHLELLWCEVGEYDGRDRELLLASFRTNIALALPGSYGGVKVPDELTDIAVAQYVRGLERRYAEDANGFHPYQVFSIL